MCGVCGVFSVCVYALFVLIVSLRLVAYTHEIYAHHAPLNANYFRMQTFIIALRTRNKMLLYAYAAFVWIVRECTEDNQDVLLIVIATVCEL